MIWFLISFFFAFFVVVRHFRRKFMSPYTLTYIFGLKGAGKSTFMAKLMLEDIENGWTVYTNMDDVVIPGVHIMNSDALTKYAPPPGSSIYIDEAGLIWDNRSFATFSSGYTEYFKLQRKYKNKVTINSQAFDVDKKIRDLIDRMFLMTNVLGCIGVARPLKRTIKVLEAQGNSESRLAMNLEFESFTHFRFFWLPKYWKWFNSFSAPPRQPAPSKVIPGEYKKPSPKNQLRALAKHLNSSFRKR